MFSVFSNVLLQVSGGFLSFLHFPDNFAIALSPSPEKMMDQPSVLEKEGSSAEEVEEGGRSMFVGSQSIVVRIASGPHVLVV